MNENLLGIYKIKKYILLFLLISFTANVQDFLAAEDTIEIGLKNNDDIQIAVIRQRLPEMMLDTNTLILKPIVKSLIPIFFPRTVESQNKDADVGLSLSFNLFNGFRKKIDLQNARIEAMNQELALADAKNQIAGLVQEKYDTFKKQLELVSLEEQNEVSAQQNLDLQQERYNIGTANSLEFRDAQINLIRAQTASIASRYQSKITKLEIEQLIGKVAIE